jgi:hypothetical protein
LRVTKRADRSCNAPPVNKWQTKATGNGKSFLLDEASL